MSAPRTTSHRVTSFGQWTTTLGADGALNFVQLRKSGDQVAVTRLRDGSGGDETTLAVWNDLVVNGDADAWFLTEFVFGRASSLSPFTRLNIPSGKPDEFTYTTPMSWNDAYQQLARLVR